ncbi:MAG TPA: SPOR domain-containing protein [Qipengyuania sp.]|nr:SPOR domain-containing protein [Qipengyuania sp.]
MGTRPGGFGSEDNWFDRSDNAAERELALEVPDERLPWLESDDDGDEPVRFDTGRLIGLGLILLVALVVLVGGIWFIASRGLGEGPAPDGSLIAAPETPYKERPADPGGKTFAGTGDTSYAVGAGKEVEAKLATAAPPPPAAGGPLATPASAPSRPSPTAAAAASLPAGTAVQVGAYSTHADAEAGWQRLSGQTDLLSGVSYRIVAGRADIGTVYRLQAVGGDKAGAQALCSGLKAAGIACQVK